MVLYHSDVPQWVIGIKVFIILTNLKKILLNNHPSLQKSRQ